MTINVHPIPYPAKSLVLKAASVISPGDLVMVSSSGYATRTVNVTDDEYIGIAHYDADQFASTGNDYYSADEIVRIEVRNAPLKTQYNNLVTPGNFVKLGSPGKVVIEATATTKTLNTVGIVIEVNSTTECTWIPL